MRNLVGFNLDFNFSLETRVYKFNLQSLDMRGVSILIKL